jgi:hypothetical protein
MRFLLGKNPEARIQEPEEEWGQTEEYEFWGSKFWILTPDFWILYLAGGF